MKRKIMLKLYLEHLGYGYRLVLRKKMVQGAHECDKCEIKGLGLCFHDADNDRRIDAGSMTANLFCQDYDYGRWQGYWKRVKK